MMQQWMLIWSIHIVIVRIFNVCAIQVIGFIISSIRLIIVRNIKVRAVVCFKWIQFSYDYTHSIFLMHSHSYFITHIYYLYFYFIKFLLNVLLWRGKHQNNGHNKWLLTAERESIQLWLVVSFWITKLQQQCTQSV